MKIIDQIPEELLDAINDFSRKLEWARRLPIYEVHKWWARRYSGIVRLFLAFSEIDLKHLKECADYASFVHDLYYNPPKVNGKKLLDPFTGGGTILIEGSVMGYHSHGIEINKLPCIFLEALRDLVHVDLNSFEREVKIVANSLSSLWTTKCHDGHDAIIIHTFLAWKDRKGRLQIKFNRIKDDVYFCEKCNKLSRGEFDKCPYCGNEFNKKHEKVEFFELSPYAIEYYCPRCNVRSIKELSIEDVRRYKLSAKHSLKIPELNETKRLLRAGLRFFEELFTPRQLITMKALLEHFKNTPYDKIAKILVSDATRACSILAYYSDIYLKVIPAFVIKSYWLPVQPVELNPIAFRITNQGLFPLGRGNVISVLRKLKRAKNFIIQQKNQTGL